MSSIVISIDFWDDISMSVIKKSCKREKVSAEWQKCFTGLNRCLVCLEKVDHKKWSSQIVRKYRKRQNNCFFSLKMWKRFVTFLKHSMTSRQLLNNLQSGIFVTSSNFPIPAPFNTLWGRQEFQNLWISLSICWFPQLHKFRRRSSRGPPSHNPASERNIPVPPSAEGDG